jgi:hypothetical protein
MPFDTRGRPETKSGAMSFLRSLSPERRGNKEPKGRSVSPFKRDKNRGNVDVLEVSQYNSESGSSIRSQKAIDAEFIDMLVSARISGV